MRIEAEQEIAAPPDAVFARIADFAAFEARARKRGIGFERLSDEPPAWRIAVDWHGFSQAVKVRVVRVRPPSGYDVALATGGLEGAARVEVAPAPGGSRLSVALDIRAASFAGRFVLQTLAFARPAMEARLKGGLARLGAEIEAGAARLSGGA